MRCLDCPELGPIEGVAKRAECCLTRVRTPVRQETAAETADRHRMKTGGLNRAQRRAKAARNRP